MYVDCILPVPLNSLFTYRVPSGSGKVGRGMRVIVPFGKNKTYIALVAAIRETVDKQIRIKNIIEIIDRKPILLEFQFNLWQWISDYYFSPLGDIFKAAIPAEMKTEKGEQRYQRRMERNTRCLNTTTGTHFDCVNTLNEYQEKAHEEILESFKNHNVTLLHGITSSGKTEIYIHLIREQLKKGHQILYLLPEIALTVQIMQRLQKIFGNRLGIYHSKYSDAERVEIWHKQLSDAPYDVILGARSAVFLPFQRLGLVIVDEEHETSYKQQDPAPRYNARSVAIMMAQATKAKVLLGSATPSLETYYNAQIGKYGLVNLMHRYSDIQLPKIEIVDTKDLQRRKIMKGPFSPMLIHSMSQAFADGRQVILFQNRRGYAPIVECKDCGWIPRCGSCDVTLTYHRKSNMCECHYCGHTYKMPEVCPQCGGRHLIDKGFGTEKIEELISQIFPQIRIARMDLDTTKTRTAYEKLILDFSEGNTDLLIGTQMVSKGLDFDNVGVVGILDADSMLSYPDFRAYEHAFLMMSQVSGRAGRKQRRGEVILQTKSPQLPIISQVVENDYLQFYNSTLQERRQFHYPPYTHLIYIYIKHSNVDIVETASIEFASRLRQRYKERVLGPERPIVAKVKSHHIRKIVLKIENGISLSMARKNIVIVKEAILKDKQYNSLHIYCDADPL